MNKNTRCARQTWKQIFIMVTNANMSMKITWQGCKIMPKTNVEQIEGNEGSYFYLYSFGDLTQKSFQRGFYVCIEFFFWKPS
jgi:hypothetical protein